MKAKKVLVSSKQHGSFSNVKFMMNSDDFRLKDESFGYTILDSNPTYKNKEKMLVSNNIVYKVLSDWSLKQI